MYIKEIKLNGFKSFADKVNIELNRNFTGIVGPNGSGKSNIVDALKWVMGEQSVKTLRGEAGMTDIIFNGSASREEARSAVVSIVLNNEDRTLPIDYTEVEIKRVLYKTGENEYYINKEKVRLKDITELFLDSFSSKESLSIIPQGKISEILSDKPEERRTIIEEAAGVLKYKGRKEDTLKKLSRTNDNLSRINMIISELETQVAPLEEQAKKAKIYKENKEKLEKIEIALIANDIASLNDEFNLIKEEANDLRVKLATLSNTEIKEKTNLEKLKLKRTDLDTRISETQKSLMVETETLNNINNKKELLKERSKYNKDSDEVKNNLSRLKEEVFKRKASYEAIRLKYESELVKEKNLQSEVDNITTELNSINSEVDLLNNKIRELTNKKFELNSKKDIIVYNIENMSKIPYAVKSVLNNPSLNGIVDRIGSLISTSDIYATAIDTALGSQVNNIVTKTDTDAKEAVTYLKRNKKGRVTFYPMNLIKPKSIDPEILKVVETFDGFISIASKLVTYDNEYYNIIMNTLGNIIVVKTIDDAIKISKSISSRYRIVTLEGEIINVGGSLTGGSLNTNGVLNEKTELDNIVKNIKLITQELTTKESDLKEALYNQGVINNNLSKKNIELLKLKEANKVLLERVNDEFDTLTKTNDEVRDLSQENNASDSELDKILKEIYKVENRKNELERKLEDLINERTNIIEDIKEGETSSNKYESKVKEINTKLNSLNVKETKLNINLDNLLNKLNEEYTMTFEHARNNYTLEMEEDEARNTISDLKRLIKSLGEVSLNSIEEYERVSNRYNFLNEQKKDLEDSENNLLAIIREMDDIMIDKFASTFKKVNIEFGHVFKELFGGGDAHLEMTDPTNVLETGVLIVANPPGKKPGSINLLSGGEKTLTAISLLFAIMNLKNVPFVILDEVESALDEVNVDKFGSYINSYKGKTQLLVITHKKKTMEYLDLLYGITMQEKGVSKLVSVKLEDIEEVKN